MIKFRVYDIIKILHLSCFFLLTTLVRCVKIQDVSGSSWRGTGSFRRASTHTSYMQKQLVLFIESRWEQVVLSSPTAPSSLTWPPPCSPCQDHIVPQTCNNIGIFDLVFFFCFVFTKRYQCIKS